MDSKKADENWRCPAESVNMNGAVANKDKTNQKQTTTNTPSLILKSFLKSLNGCDSKKPPINVSAKEIINVPISPSWYI
jgi:hypothetical protein